MVNVKKFVSAFLAAVLLLSTFTLYPAGVVSADVAAHQAFEEDFEDGSAKAYSMVGAGLEWTGNLNHQIADVDGSSVLAISGGGSGQRAIVFRLNESITGEIINMGFDWHPGTVSISPNEGRVSVLDSAGNVFLTLHKKTASAPIEISIGANQDDPSSRIPTEVMNEQWVHVDLTINTQLKTMDLALTSNVDEAQTTTLTELELPANVDYQNDVRDIRFLGTRASGANLSWTTYLDNVIVAEKVQPSPPEGPEGPVNPRDLERNQSYEENFEPDSSVNAYSIVDATGYGVARLGDSIQEIDGSTVLQFSGGGSGGRARVFRLNDAIAGDVINMNFDWNPGIVSNPPNEGRVSIQDSQENVYLTLHTQLDPSPTAIEVSIGSNVDEQVTTEVLNQQWLNVDLTINHRSQTMDLTLTSKADESQTTTIADIEFPSSINYQANVRDIRFIGTRAPGINLNWTTHLDNVNIVSGFFPTEAPEPTPTQTPTPTDTPTPTPTVTPDPTNPIEGPTSWYFDLGLASGPVAEGYIGVNETTVYTPELGYGTLAATGGRVQGGPDDLRRDFLLMANATFVVDVTPGVYHVKVISGQQDGVDNVSFSIEGGPSHSGRTNGGEFAESSQVVEVTDGQLTIAFGGAQYSRTNAIEVVRLPDPPALTVDSIESSATSSVTLTWEASAGATSYNVYRKANYESSFAFIGSSEETNFTDSNVELGFTYEYQATTLKVDYESSRGNTVTAVIKDANVAVPSSPANVNLTEATATSVSLSWEATNDAILYYVYRSRFANDRFERIGTATDASFEDSNVSTHQNMYYQIRAVNAGGLSDPSATVVVEPTFRYVRQMEQLDRGLVAVNTDNGVYVSWRMFGTDPATVWFDLYRNGVKVNDEPITNSTNYFDPDGHAASKYKLYIRQGSGAYETEEVGVWAQQYLSIPLDKPANAVTPDAVEHQYYASDASVGDLDGDGEYEIVIKWEAGGKDNSHGGYTPNVYFDAYKLNGKKLWRIDAGHNIRAGAHYTQFMVYDFDGDGKAEIVFKTADGTVDGVGGVIGDITADHRNTGGYILTGPEYLTIFNGETGAAMDTVNYTPPRGDVGAWGDGYGNRVDRFLAGVAYLDGEKPSMIFSRGYYTRAVIAAYDFIDGELVERWVFDSNDEGNGAYAGQGNHNLSVADVDGDGFDEIIFGAASIDHDGTGLYSTGWGHGDALHVSDFDPERPGLEIFQPHEHTTSPYGFGMRDAETGENVWGYFTGTDVGRGLAADIDPRYIGAEMWSSSSWDGSTGRSGLFTAKGDPIAAAAPRSINHAIWWDGDLLRELLDHDFSDSRGYGIPKIEKWDYENNRLEKIYQPEGTRTSNWTKGNPSLQADILGDWREELIVASGDSTELQIHTTTAVTEHRIFTLMHDSVYRTAIAWQNVGYNQPPHTGFYLGVGMVTPSQPSIYTGDELHPEQGEAQWAIASLTGPSRVYANGALSLTARVDQVTNPFDTAEVVVKYDPAKLSFATVTDAEQNVALAAQAITSLHDNVQVLSTAVKPTEGEINIILSMVGSDAAITSAGDLFRLHANVKAGLASGTIITSITQFNVALEGNLGEVGLAYAQHGATVGTIITTDKQALTQAIRDAENEMHRIIEGSKIGQYKVGAKMVLQRGINAATSVLNDGGASQLDVDLALRTLEDAMEQLSTKLITLVEGQSHVSIRDLSILSKHFGITSQDTGWELVAKADLYDDGEISIRVLATVARMILVNWSLED